METKEKIFKRKSGKSKGKWVVRLEYFDEILGKKRSMERERDKRSEVVDLRSKLANDIKKSHGQIQTGERMTFDDLITIAKRYFYKDAVIVEGRKVSGIRSFEKTKPHLNNLNKFFGKRLIVQITTESLTDYKLWRLNTVSVRTGRKIKISTVNRELSVMRRMMRYAHGKGWILKDIFFNAKVIETSSNVERTRLLSKAEEARLLDSCEGDREVPYTRNWKGKKQKITAKISVDNPHLRAMIIIALDTAMRRGEILKLRWKDIDFSKNLIKVVGTHTKTQRERTVPLSDRVKEEVNRIRQFTEGNNLFPFNDIKRSFATAKKMANIDDLRFHDLRRTAITRWVWDGIPMGTVAKFAGHSQMQTTMKYYTSTDDQMLQEVNEKINAFNSKPAEIENVQSEMIN